MVGELCAVIFYLIHGYRLVAWRKRFGRLEADLILRRGGEAVLVEVKSGFRKGVWASPERMFNETKVKNLGTISRAVGGKRPNTASVELFVADFSRAIPRFRRYRRVCLW